MTLDWLYPLYVGLTGILHLVYLLFACPLTCFAAAWHSGEVTTNPETALVIGTCILFCLMNGLMAIYCLVRVGERNRRRTSSLAVLGTAVALSMGTVAASTAFCLLHGLPTSPNFYYLLPSPLSIWLFLIIALWRGLRSPVD